MTEPKKFTPEELEDAQLDKQTNLVLLVTSILKEEGWTRKQLADAIGIKDSALTRLLTEDSNPTLKSIIQVELSTGHKLLLTPQEFEYRFFSDTEYRNELNKRAIKRNAKKGRHQHADGAHFSKSTVFKPLELTPDQLPLNPQYEKWMKSVSRASKMVSKISQ